MNLVSGKTRYNTIINNLNCVVTTADYRKLGQKIQKLKNMAEIANRSVCLYDVFRKEFLLKVDRHLELLGYDPEEAVNLNRIENYHAMIHKDDLPFLYDSEIRMYEFLQPIRSVEKKDYKLVYDYRVRARNGEYIRFLHQMVLFELDKYFNSWILLILSDILAKYPDDAVPRRYLIHTKTHRLHLFNNETGVKANLLTHREKEVIELVAQGMESREIADRLFVSVNTVNNHRQHILLKTQTKNIAQAVNYLKCIGLI